MMSERKLVLSIAAVIVTISTSMQPSIAQLRRLFLPKRPAAEVLAERDIVVVSNAVKLYNEFRSRLPEKASTSFIPLEEIEGRIVELRNIPKHVVYLVDRTRSRFPLQHRELLPYDARLIRIQDVLIAGSTVKLNRKSYARLFISAPSYHAALQAMDKLLTTNIREVRDLKRQWVWQVPILVVVTNAGQESINVFGESIQADFVWVPVEKMAKVEDLLVTETELYILTGDQPIPGGLKERLPHPIDTLRPNQSVVVRKSKGGRYYRILYYAPNERFLHYLLTLYSRLEDIPTEPRLTLHLDLSNVRRMMVFPFADAPAVRLYVTGFGNQVVDAVKNAGLVDQVIIAHRSMFDDPAAWEQYCTGSIPVNVVRELAKKHNVQLILAGRIVDADALSITSQGLISRPSPAADRRVWQVRTERKERVSIYVEARMFDARTGQLIWNKRLEGKAARKQLIHTSLPVESRTPPAIEPERVEHRVLDTSLYQTAAVDAVQQLIKALQGEALWAVRPKVVQAVPPRKPPTPKPPAKEGQVGAVEDDVVYIDLGAADGVQVGDEFVVVRKVQFRTARAERTIEEPIGVIRIIEVQPDISKAMILHLERSMQVKPQDIVRMRIPSPHTPAPPKPKGAEKETAKQAK